MLNAELKEHSSFYIQHSALNLKLINVFDTFNVFITVAVEVQVNAGGVGFREIAFTDIQAFILIDFLHIHSPNR